MIQSIIYDMTTAKNIIYDMTTNPEHNIRYGDEKSIIYEIGERR